MKLTPSQQLALDKISAHTQGRFLLRGPAGSGKSTLMKEAIEVLGEGVTLLAPTGKAAVRLRETTGRHATTIHSVIYNVWRKDRELKFSLKQGEIGAGDTAIVDEASMVTDRMASDLEKIFPQVFYIGDHYQLPPVKADDWFGTTPADAELTEVMRQALDSPILSLVTAIRQGKPSPMACESDALTIRSTANIADLMEADQVICATNATRLSLNKLIRGKHGRMSPVPIVGDRLINLLNRAIGETYVCNGAQMTVEGVAGELYNVRLDSGEVLTRVELSLEPPEFQRLGQVPQRSGPPLLYVDYAYAVTCHKAQGSQWPSVLVYDDSGYMKGKGDRMRWAYTALSRPSKKLVWIRKT